MMNGKKGIIANPLVTPVLFASAALLAAGFAGCKPGSQQAAAPASAKAVRQDVAGVVLLNGEAVVPPNSRADILPPYRTVVSKVYSGVGQSVRKGEVLLELSPPSVQASYEQNRQAVRAAETALKNADVQYSQAVKSALSRLEQARQAEQKARQAAQQNLAADAAPGDVNGATAAADTGLSLQQATADRVAAEAALLQARQSKDAGTAPYEQQLAQARAAFGGAQGARKASQVKAPISGEVLAFNARPNAEIGQDADAPIVTLVDLSDVTVHAPVLPNQNAYVRKGKPVTLTFAQIPGQTFSGEVTDVDAQPSPSGPKYTAIIGFKNDKGRVKPGMKGSVSVRIGEAKNAVVVPNDAVDHDSTGKPIVHVLRNNEWVAAVVDPGLSDAQVTEIKTGVEEGETVQVTPGQK